MAGGIGRSVKVRHFSCVSSMTLIDSLQTVHAAVPSVNMGSSHGSRENEGTRCDGEMLPALRRRTIGSFGSRLNHHD